MSDFPASAKKDHKAREQGNIGASPFFFSSLAFLVLSIGGSWFSDRVFAFYTQSFQSVADYIHHPLQFTSNERGYAFFIARIQQVLTGALSLVVVPVSLLFVSQLTMALYGTKGVKLKRSGHGSSLRSSAFDAKRFVDLGLAWMGSWTFFFSMTLLALYVLLRRGLNQPPNLLKNDCITFAFLFFVVGLLVKRFTTWKRSLRLRMTREEIKRELREEYGHEAKRQALFARRSDLSKWSLFDMPPHEYDKHMHLCRLVLTSSLPPTAVALAHQQDDQQQDHFHIVLAAKGQHALLLSRLAEERSVPVFHEIYQGSLLNRLCQNVFTSITGDEKSKTTMTEEEQRWLVSLLSRLKGLRGEPNHANS